MIKKKQVNLKNKPKMIFDISSKKRYKTYEPQSNVTYHKKKLEKIQREKKHQITQMMVGKQWVKR